MAATPAQELLEAAKCYTCLGLSLSESLQLALLDRISQSQGSGGAVAWGSITGLLANQADLAAALGARLLTANNLSELSATAATARANLAIKGTCIQFSLNGLTAPLDSTTYYIGADVQNTALDRAPVYTNAQIEIPASGTITKVWYKARVYTVLGSNENVATSIRLNDTTDFATVNMQYNAVNQETTVSGLSQAVTAGDKFAMKIVTPAWATNPTGVQWAGWIYIE